MAQHENIYSSIDNTGYGYGRRIFVEKNQLIYENWRNDNYLFQHNCALHILSLLLTKIELIIL